MTTFFIILAALILIIGLATPSNNSNNVVEKKPKEGCLSWEYKETKDPMTDEIKITAMWRANLLNSHSVATVVVPYYSGVAGADSDVWVMVDNYSIFESNNNEENYIRVRFDSEPAKKYYFQMIHDDGGRINPYPNRLRINGEDFIENCKSAHKILVEIPLRKEGRSVFEFSTVEPLKWE